MPLDNMFEFLIHITKSSITRQQSEEFLGRQVRSTLAAARLSLGWPVTPSEIRVMWVRGTIIGGGVVVQTYHNSLQSREEQIIASGSWNCFRKGAVNGFAPELITRVDYLRASSNLHRVSYNSEIWS